MSERVGVVGVEGVTEAVPAGGNSAKGHLLWCHVCFAVPGFIAGWSCASSLTNELSNK